jgi:phage baseplate assembly protein W
MVSTRHNHLKQSFENALESVIGSNNKRKQGSEIRAILMPCGNEVGLNYKGEVDQKASFRSANK